MQCSNYFNLNVETADGKRQTATFHLPSNLEHRTSNLSHAASVKIKHVRIIWQPFRANEHLTGEIMIYGYKEDRYEICLISFIRGFYTILYLKQG